MPMPLADLAGNRFGRLVVTGLAKDRLSASGRRSKYWNVQCDCGSVKSVAASALTRGYTLSCGCLRREATIGPNTKHGEAGRTKTAEYRIWAAMRNRCNNLNDSRYCDYGGRGIKICERWSIYANFLSDMGRRPSDLHSLDRYPDNDGNYEKDNCRWATASQQNANQRRRARVDQFSDRDLIDELLRRGYGQPLRVPQHH